MIVKAVRRSAAFGGSLSAAGPQRSPHVSVLGIIMPRPIISPIKWHARDPTPPPFRADMATKYLDDAKAVYTRGAGKRYATRSLAHSHARMPTEMLVKADNDKAYIFRESWAPTVCVCASPCRVSGGRMPHK